MGCVIACRFELSDGCGLIWTRQTHTLARHDRSTHSAASRSPPRASSAIHAIKASLVPDQAAEEFVVTSKLMEPVGCATQGKGRLRMDCDCGRLNST